MINSNIFFNQINDLLYAASKQNISEIKGVNQAKLLLNEVIHTISQRSMKDLMEASDENIANFEKKFKNLNSHLTSVEKKLLKPAHTTPYAEFNEIEPDELQNLKAKVINCQLIMQALQTIRIQKNYSPALADELNHTAAYHGEAINSGINDWVKNSEESEKSIQKRVKEKSDLEITPANFQKYVRAWTSEQLGKSFPMPGSYLIRDSSTIAPSQQYDFLAVSYITREGKLTHTLIARNHETGKYHFANKLEGKPLDIFSTPVFDSLAHAAWERVNMIINSCSDSGIPNFEFKILPQPIVPKLDEETLKKIKTGYIGEL